MSRRALCLTVDLDRDVNLPVEGRTAAGSVDRGAGTAPRFASAERGLELLSGLLDELGMRATYFAEAETLAAVDGIGHLSGHETGMHGVAHEDLTALGDGDAADVLRRSAEAVADAVGRRPVCFRAPYMKADARIRGLLGGLGVRIDSSEYAPAAAAARPYMLDGLTEVAVPEGRDRDGRRITGYLWPMHEGRRPPADFIGLPAGLEEGVIVLATHTWHLCESRDRGIMDPETVAANLGDVREVLTGLMDAGFPPMTLPAAVARFPPALY